MRKCRLCKQIFNNLTIIYNNRLKSLTQIILKLKGFKDSFDINNNVALCRSCLKGVENVALFWENIPEAKAEAANILENLEETNTNSLFRVEHNLPAITSPQEHNDYDLNGSAAVKHEPIKLRIKLPPKRKKREQCNSTNTSVDMEPLQKRTTRCPQRYNDFQITATKMAATPVKATEPINEVSFNKLPHVALLRLKNGKNIGTLAEIEKEVTCKIRILCQICRQVFRFEKHFQKHLTTHFSCDVQQKEDFWNHYLFYCKLCDKSFPMHGAVRKHYKFAHSEERLFKCLHCDANFKYKFNLNYHLSTKHEIKKRFECTFCKKMFFMHYELKIHVRTHTKERPYKCELCPFAFAHKSNLKTHLRVKHFKNSKIPTILPNEFKQSTISSTQFIPPDILLEKNVFLADLNDPTLKDAVNSNEQQIVPPEMLSEREKVTQYHLNEDPVNNQQSTISSEKLMPSEIPLQQNSALQYELNGSIITESDILTAFESLVENLREENIHTIAAETMLNTENSAQSNVAPESTLTNSEDNQILKVTAISENSGGFLQSQPKLSIFQLDSSLLKVLPSASFLGLKKWPKSYQNPSENQLQLVKSSTNFNKEKLNKLEQNVIENITQTDSDSSNYLVQYKPLQNTESLEIISTQIGNNSTVLHSPQTAADLKLETENLEDSCLKLSNKPASIILQQKPVKDVNNELKTWKINSNKSATKVSHEINVSQSWKEIKVSSRPIKIKQFLKSNQTPNESHSKFTTESLKSSTNISKNPCDTGLSNSQLKPFTTNSAATRQSLLKPVLKNPPPAAALSLVKPSINQQTVLPLKPLITKLEILPPFQFLTSLQKSSATANIIKPPNGYKFQCPYCYKYFKQKYPLTKHIRTHTGEKPYKCNLCPKSYADASNYKKHKILHKNAAEALNISRTTTATTSYIVQSSPTYSTVSDPDPDGIEVMQTLKKFESSTEGDDESDDGIDDNASTSSDHMESQMWEDVLDQALNSDELRESIRRNLLGFNNAILHKSMQQITNTIDLKQK